MAEVPATEDLETLLDVLCVELGICFQGETYNRLVDSPPADAAAFADAVFREYGMDPGKNERLYRQVQFRVDQVFNRGE